MKNLKLYKDQILQHSFDWVGYPVPDSVQYDGDFYVLGDPLEYLYYKSNHIHYVVPE